MLKEMNLYTVGSNPSALKCVEEAACRAYDLVAHTLFFAALGGDTGQG